MSKKSVDFPLLRISGIKKSFNGIPILRGIDLQLYKGETVALLGSNGCGKSTLLKCCNRLVEADSGQILLQGIDLRLLGEKDLRKARTRMGVVFQKHNLVPRLSSLTNVIHGHLGHNSGFRFWLQSLAPKAVREKALECLDSVGMAHLAERRASLLSGGESQRVAIARALMQDPLILFADEPVASLDPKVGHEVMRLFIDNVKKHDLSVLFVSHDLDHALEYADRIVAIRYGEKVLDSPVSKVKKHELKEIYD